jgi:hypothetical protein
VTRDEENSLLATMYDIMKKAVLSQDPAAKQRLWKELGELFLKTYQ